MDRYGCKLRGAGPEFGMGPETCPDHWFGRQAAIGKVLWEAPVSEVSQGLQEYCRRSGGLSGRKLFRDWIRGARGCAVVSLAVVAVS